MKSINGTITTEKGNEFHYIQFGEGNENLVMIPGLGDGLVTVKGKARFGPIMFRKISKRYRVTMISRKNNLEAGASTESMADDQVEAMRELGIGKAHIIGVSQGGMIAQFIAARYPEIVEKLILVATTDVHNEIIDRNIETWTRYARENRFYDLMLDMNLKSHPAGMHARVKMQSFVFHFMKKPENYTRFYIQANACWNHDAREILSQIKCPTLIIGGEQDETLGAEPSRRLYKAIEGSTLYMYLDLGHGLYEDAKDFHDRVLAFLL